MAVEHPIAYRTYLQPAVVSQFFVGVLFRTGGAKLQGFKACDKMADKGSGRGWLAVLVQRSRDVIESETSLLKRKRGHRRYI